MESWRDWVLYGQEFRACPPRDGAQADDPASRICAWPGELTLDVTESAAGFSQQWELFAEAWVPLPGDGALWPAEVVVDGATAAVVSRDGRPSIRLDAGSHALSGTLRWDTRPASIPIPVETALLSLTLDGAPVGLPELEDGTLWLGIRPGEVVEQDRLDIAVYRLLRDGLPVTLETRIELDVAGQNRELALTGALLQGFTDQSLAAGLPARLADDGTLSVQASPGRWSISLLSRAPEGIAELQLAEAAPPWPAEEIWSFASQPRLRVAGLEGAPAIDAELARAPASWRNLPAYQIAAGQSLNLVERGRNDADAPNVLELARHLWMDFDRGGFTALDEVAGEINSNWRLDMADPFTMTMAASGDSELLVTEGAAPGVQGVEVREPALLLEATARIGPLRELPVTGYLDSFDLVETVLHLPPAHRLMAAPGADGVSGAWVDSWRLLDIFLVLIVTIAAWKLLGGVAGGVALAAMVLTFHEPLAPQWAWLNVLVATALAGAIGAGRLAIFSRWYRNASLVALIVLLIPFLASQMRAVVFPQLEPEFGGPSFLQSLAPASRPMTRGFNVTQPMASLSLGFPPGTPATRAAANAIMAEGIEETVVTGTRLEEAAVTTGTPIGAALPRHLPGAVVQTGPGLPDWRWNNASLVWSGPVEPGQTFRMVIFGPWLVGLWRTAGAILALALLGFLLRPHIDRTGLTALFRGGAAKRVFATLFRGGGAKRTLAALFRGGPAAPVLAALLVAPADSPAQGLSEFPSPELLDELRQRLLAPEPCHPSCAELADAELTLDESSLTVTALVAVESAVAVPMPGAADGWRPATIVVNGEPAAWLHRDRNGAAWTRLPAGVNEVVLRGPVPNDSGFSLPFPLAPRRIAVDAPAWDVRGLVGGQIPSGALQFARLETADAAEGEAPAATRFPPYVRVHRVLTLGLDWSVETRVSRVAPSEEAFTLAVDLLPDEAVVTPGVEVAAGQALIALGTDQDNFSWESRLPTAATLALTAAENAPWTERWSIVPSAIWNVRFDGVPRTPPLNPGTPQFVPEFNPRPGETLTLSLTQPEPASGDTIAVDRLDYTMRVGERSSSLTLDLDYRSTRAMQHALEIPEGSVLETVLIDREQIPLRLNGNRLELPIAPGDHDVTVNWRLPGGVGLSTVLPEVDLGVGASNVLASIRLPENRWILFTFGPTLGPAVLYWSELLLIGIGAVLLGRLRASPLRFREWLLLGLGLSTFAWPILLLAVGWFLALAWRERMQLELSRLWFNTMQLGFGLFTAVALTAIVAAIPQGLLGEPDMQIATPDGLPQMSWFTDRIAGPTPAAGVLSVSMWFYRIAMLAWALWLSFALLRWIRWAWQACNHKGIWRGKVADSAA